MTGRLSEVRQGVSRSVQSVTARKYLVGAVLAWVLVVYLASSPSLRSAGPPSPGHSSSTPAGGVTPGLTAPSFSAPAESTAPITSSGFGSFTLPPLSFAPPPAPQSTPQLSCPFPIPQSQTTPFNPGIFLSFEGPFIELAGPFSSYFIPTLGAIAPIVPIATPLVYLSEPVMNEVTPDVSTVVTDYVTITDAAGLNSPQEKQYAAQFEPYWIQLLDALTPVEQQLASSTAGQCLVLFENELAVMDSQQSLKLPALPFIPSGIPPGSSSAAVAQAVAADTSSPFAHLSVPWSGGIPAALPAAVTTFRAAGKPVLVQLVDQPPASQTMGGTGFPDFVAQVVHELPAASAFEVDAPAGDPSGAGQMADLVHGLASADLTRLPGQLIGVGVPSSAEGSGAGPFWGAFKGAMKGFQPNMVDFVAAGLTPQTQSTMAADSAEAAQAARTLESSFTTLGGVPADVPVFGTLVLDTADPATATSVQQQLASYLAALRGLHVTMLGISAG